MRQIAALPYRTIGSGINAPVSVLLITSRATKRWVIPKGNPESGLVPHAAAALEAEEEAGVRGAACPTALGSYRYRKLRSSGASVMVDVDVFPLAVQEELPGWKEAAERERRWFSLAEAAKAVEETDLADLFRSFGPVEFNKAARRGFGLGAIAKKSKVGPMFAWFQKLLPRTGNFFELFEAHAISICAAANALSRLLEDSSAMRDNIREIRERESDADNVLREVLSTVRRTFLTPFDRGAITSLIASMDTAIDQMQAAASAIDLYELKEFDQEMRDIAAIIVDAARVTAEALPLLRDVGANGIRLHELTERLVRMESHADEIHAAGLKKAFQRYGETDTLRFVVAREIYSHLERITDSFEDVAYEIDDIVIDHS